MEKKKKKIQVVIVFSFIFLELNDPLFFFSFFFGNLDK